MGFQLEKFCCGLKRGTAIIGILQSVLSFMFMILCAAYAENPHELIDLSDVTFIPNLNTLRCLLIIIATASAIQCVLSILIIFGSETNRPLLLLPWLVFNPIAILVYMIGTLIAVILHTGLHTSSFIVGHLLVGTAVSLVGAYNVMTVYGLYKHLRSLNF